MRVRAAKLETNRNPGPVEGSRGGRRSGDDGAARGGTGDDRWAPKSHASEEPQRKRLSPLVRHVISHLEDNYTDPGLLRDLAQTLKKSSFQVIRSFRRELDMTPHAYLISLRVARAIDLLESGETIAQTAAAAGFSDQSHLTRHFKRWTGTTPGEYRRSSASARITA